LSLAKKRYILVESPMTVWSIAPVLLSDMVPVKGGCTADHPFALGGSLEVLYENVVAPH
jgi:hypothetical protein